VQIFFVALFVLVGLFFAGMGVSFLRGRVSRNAWYGFRTTSSLADDAIWYPTNRLMGQCLIVGGALLAVAMPALWALNLTPLALALSGLAMLFTVTLLMVILTLSLQQRLLRARRGA
jgi:hypothetical protein